MTASPSRTALAGLIVVLVSSLASCRPASGAQRSPAASARADEQAVRDARAAQNTAIVAGDADRVADYWTEDVEIRRALGQLVVGRDAYRQLFVVNGSRDSALVYQRQPSSVVISAQWPLAYERGTWAGHLGRVDGPAVIGGEYAAQWVKRASRWLIRGEVYVALSCASVGCALSSVP